MWFQKDGDTSRTACGSLQILRNAFLDRKMSKFCDIDSPFRSPNLIAPDFFPTVTNQQQFNSLKKAFEKKSNKLCRKYAKM